MSLTGINGIDQYETEEEIPESFHGAALIQCVGTNELWLSNGVTTERVGSHLSGSTTISVTDNTNAALRITQLGTGNALLVEDSANPDSTPFVIDRTGNVGIGTATLGTYKLDVSGGPARLNNTLVDGISIEINATGTGNRFAYIDFHGDDTYTDYGLRLLRGNTGANAVSSLTHKGTGNLFFVTEEAAPIVFNTTNTERMRIDSSGNVGIGTSSPNASAILDAQSTTKGVRFPNMTTTQKNAIASPAAGLVIFDTTLAKLCLYTGAAWQTITSV
jgi:hypothetical protein